MKVHEYREMMRYLTRQEPTSSPQVASNEERVGYSEGSKLTGTDKTLEQNVKDDHKAYNDYRKSIGSPTVPLDNEYIRMWIRTRLNSGGPANKQPQKIIPLNLESVAFKLFQDKLDNLSYNQKQTVYDYIEDNRNKKATGGRVNLANGTEEPYNPEIPSLGFSDPIDILEQRMINEKDPIKVEALNHLLENAKKERKAKEMEREEFKKSQKEKGIKYKEDFPSEAAYFAETGKQLLTNPKYFLGKGAKGIVEGTEFLVGQPLQTLFDQEGKNFEFYKMVGGEKLGINKFIEENIPKNPTTGTLLAGETAEIAGSVMDPFLAYGLAKGAIKGTKAKPPTTAVDETINPMRRDILKTGAVMGGGAALYPIAKKIGMFDELAKGAKTAVRVLPKVKGMPEWFSPLVNKIMKGGVDVPSPSGFEIIKKLEIPSKTGKPEVITFTQNKATGSITIESNVGGVADSSFELHYSPPKTDINVKTGEPVEYLGDFYVVENRPKPDYNNPGKIEFDYDTFDIDTAYSDLERLEKIGTGKIKDAKKIEQRAAGRKKVEKDPYDDIMDRYPGPVDYPGEWEKWLNQRD